MGQKKKILIVDDERDIVKAVMIRLQGAGYEVVTAFDGAQGVFMAHKEKPDLIILDIRMPAGNCPEVKTLHAYLYDSRYLPDRESGEEC
jgi:DNA-binding response OmpR family regulator